METLNELLLQMCAEAGLASARVLDAVLVGNTAMHHLAAGLPVEQLGHAPFSPATTGPLTIPAQKLGLKLRSHSRCLFPAGDCRVCRFRSYRHVIGHRCTAITLAILSPWISGLTRKSAWSQMEKPFVVPVPPGPPSKALTSMKACAPLPGAIERARWSTGSIQWQTIEDRPPVGICGSGILDVVAALQDGHLVKPTGALLDRQISEVILVPAEQSGVDHDLVVTRKDIHEIQLAKSAIRSGLETLLEQAKLSSNDLAEFIVAGAFGTYLDIRSAVRVGMFPPLPLDRFKQVGNAAGVGAKQMLISVDKRREAEEISRQIGYVELTTQTPFYRPVHAKSYS